MGEKQIGFVGVLVFCNGASISLLDESIGYQAIESLLFTPIETFGLFHAPPGDDITKDRQFFVGPYELPTVRFRFTLDPSPTQEVPRITPQKAPATDARSDAIVCWQNGNPPPHTLTGWQIKKCYQDDV